MDVSVDDESLKKLGHLIANEYDLRSDEDSLFIFHKVMKARKQVCNIFFVTFSQTSVYLTVFEVITYSCFNNLPGK